jgi:heme-binding HmuY-like protein
LTAFTSCGYVHDMEPSDPRAPLAPSATSGGIVTSAGRDRAVSPVAVVAILAMIGLAAALVTLSLRQPDVPAYAPTPPAPREAGRALVGPVLYTVDASSPERWRYFSFRLGSVLEDAGPREWDLAFRRYQIIANGGAEFPGRAGIADLGTVAFAGVTMAPENGYQLTTGGPDPRNPAIAGWYEYGYFSHVLSPKPHVWAVRTADGRYAKLELVSYYCPRSQPGCVTFRYVYQGDGSRTLAPP